MADVGQAQSSSRLVDMARWLAAVGAVILLTLPGTPVGMAQSAGSQAANVLVSSTVPIQLKRDGWTDYAPATFGTTLREGDLLRPVPPADLAAAEATIVCQDLTLVLVSEWPSGVPCTPLDQPPQGGEATTPPRGGGGDGFPVLVAPRKTRLLSSQPTIIWTPVPGVDTYTVTVRGGGDTWSAQVQGVSMLRYPQGAPQLRPGVAYSVTVAGGGRSSGEDDTPGLAFTLVTPEDASNVQASQLKIQTLGLPYVPTEFLVAQLYANQNLNADAIDILAGLSEAVQEPAIERALGDRYAVVALYRLAEDHFVQATALSAATGDIEGEGLAAQQLASIYSQFGDAADEVQRLHEAASAFAQLGDGQGLGQVESQLNALGQ